MEMITIQVMDPHTDDNIIIHQNSSKFKDNHLKFDDFICIPQWTLFIVTFCISILLDDVQTCEEDVTLQSTSL